MTGSEDAAAAGMAALLRAMRDDNLSPSGDLDEASASLRDAGERGSDAVAGLLQELLDSRSPSITWALAAAKACAMTTPLREAVRAVGAAPELRDGSASQGRFTPEIFGDGKIGWTSGTASRGRRLSQEVLDLWDPPAVDATGPGSAASPEELDPDIRELVAAAKRFAAGQEHAYVLEDTGQRVGPRAADALRRLSEADRSGPMATGLARAVRSWPPGDALSLIRHALSTGYPGAEYYGRLYLEANPTPEARHVGRDCLPQMKDAEERNALRAFLGV